MYIICMYIDISSTYRGGMSCRRCKLVERNRKKTGSQIIGHRLIADHWSKNDLKSGVVLCPRCGQVMASHCSLTGITAKSLIEGWHAPVSVPKFCFHLAKDFSDSCSARIPGIFSRDYFLLLPPSCFHLNMRLLVSLCLIRLETPSLLKIHTIQSYTIQCHERSWMFVLPADVFVGGWTGHKWASWWGLTRVNCQNLKLKAMGSRLWTCAEGNEGLTL